MNSTILAAALRDAKAIIRGFRDLYLYIRSDDKDSIDVSISLFSATDGKVQSGKEADYMLSFANVADENLTCRFVFEIQRVGETGQSKTLCASFEKNILLPTKLNRTMCVTYNWKDSASFSIEGTISPPDKVLNGCPLVNGRYEIHAMLFDAGNRPVENLYLIQELVG